ncbi:MAG: purine-nucleoside phosphorylase [Ruminiclostridium sp.]|nr:purine-nucleoside phosphorylase [Ruminiclostridium sp.]
MSVTPTPHIAAQKGEIASKVLLPGDPLRAKFIAENYLSEVKCYNEIRNMLGFTGLYKGERVSVQGSGMGVSSVGIYCYELYNFYDVESIIRIGTAGALMENVKPRDIVIAQGACHDCNCDKQYRLPGTYAPIADFGLIRRAVELTEAKNITCHVGNVLTGEVYYDASGSLADWSKMGVLAVEMESAALYMTAAHAGKKALCILTVTNNPLTGSEDVTPEEREKSLTDMIEIALGV